MAFFEAIWSGFVVMWLVLGFVLAAALVGGILFGLAMLCVLAHAAWENVRFWWAVRQKTKERRG